MSRPNYFTPSEVAAHSLPTDCWASYLGKVYDLTPLCEEHAGDVLLKPITDNAGRDISHWFDPENGEVCQQHCLCITFDCINLCA